MDFRARSLWPNATEMILCNHGISSPMTFATQVVCVGSHVICRDMANGCSIASFAAGCLNEVQNAFDGSFPRS